MSALAEDVAYAKDPACLERPEGVCPPTFSTQPERTGNGVQMKETICLLFVFAPFSPS